MPSFEIWAGTGPESQHIIENASRPTGASVILSHLLFDYQFQSPLAHFISLMLKLLKRQQLCAKQGRHYSHSIEGEAPPLF